MVFDQRGRTTRRAAIAIALETAFALLGAQAPPANVLLVTIDTVRADHLGAYGDTNASTPWLDRLAREGVRFADATTQAPLTGPAHAAILTGMYPARFGIRDNATSALPAEASMLAEMFKARGYRTGGFIGAFILDRQYGFAQGFDEFDAIFPNFTAGMQLQARRSGSEVAADAVRWLSAKTEQPFFGWVHLYDAHAPYESEPAYRARFPTSPYDGAIASVDKYVGELLTALAEGGTLDRTVVSVLADHGEGLGDHGESEHGVFLYESVLHIPWLLRLPQRAHAGTVVPRQVRTIDVVPTLLELTGGTVPAGLDGQSLVKTIEGRPDRDVPASYAETFYPKLHFGWSELTSVRADGWKYVDAPRPELYDLSHDSSEGKNLVEVRGALANGLSSEGRRIQGSFGPGARAPAAQPDAETIARLRSLGYVGVTAPQPSGRGADPKDTIASYEANRHIISRALEAIDRGQADLAITQLKALVAKDQRAYDAHLFLGDAYASKGQSELAVGEYAAAGVLNPSSAAPDISAARVFLKQGDLARAREHVDNAARLEPGASDLALVRGMLEEASGRSDDALRAFQAAVEANASDIQAHAHLASLALKMNRPEIARPEFERLLKLGYRPSRMHFGLGQAAELEGDPKRAASEYRLTLQLEPGFAPARSALAKLGGQ